MASDEDPSSTTSSDAASASVSSDAASPSETSEPAEKGGAEDAVAVDAFLGTLKAGYGDAGSAHVTMRMVGGPAAVRVVGDMSYGDAGTAARVRTTVPGVQGLAEVRLTGDQAFMSVPGVTPPGKFFELPPDSPLLQGITQGAGSLSLDESFQAFDAALEKVKSLGIDEIGGEPTKHYRLWVDSKKALKASGMAATPEGEAALGAIPPTLVYDLWLDGDDHMRRLTFEVGPMRVVMDLTHWGVPVTVEAPPASDLVAAPSGVTGSM